MNGLWSIFSKYIQALILAASGFVLGYNLCHPWLTLLIQASDHALERWAGGLVFIFRFIFFFFYVGPLPAIVMAIYFGKAAYLMSLSVHQEIFEFLASQVERTNHALMAKLAGICAFWVSFRLVATIATTKVFYSFLFRQSDLAAIVIPPLVFLLGAAVTKELYKNYLKQLYSRGEKA